jgi:hypothetical protein
MKNAKKQKVAQWKLVVSIGAVCALGVVVYFGVVIINEVDKLRRDVNMAQYQINTLSAYQEVKLSADGEWFLIPEARLKFPYFGGLDDTDSILRGMRSPRYINNLWVTGEKTTISLTTEIIDNTVDSNFWGGCMNPFMFKYGDNSEPFVEGSFEDLAKYETVAEIRVADGRTIELMQRTAGSGFCLQQISGSWGQALIEKYIRVESY